MEVNSESTEKASWNLSNAIIMEVGNLLQESSSNIVRGKMQKSFVALYAIRLRISGYLSKEERTKFKNMETKLNQLFNLKAHLCQGFNSKSREIFNKKYSLNLMNLFDSYNEYIMDYLKKYGLLIPAKEDKTNLIA